MNKKDSIIQDQFFFIQYLESGFCTEDEDTVQLSQTGFLSIGHAEFKEGHKKRGNVYFSLQDARDALKKMKVAMNVH